MYIYDVKWQVFRLDEDEMSFYHYRDYVWLKCYTLLEYSNTERCDILFAFIKSHSNRKYCGRMRQGAQIQCFERRELFTCVFFYYKFISIYHLSAQKMTGTECMY